MGNRTNAKMKLTLFTMLAAMFSDKGMDEKTSNKRAYHHAMMGGGNPDYIPRKHTVMTYGQQNRLAKKRKKARAKAPK
jgi:hypothetical protein